MATATNRKSGGAGHDEITVGFALLPGFPLMAYAAAVEPLRAANCLAGRPLYKWWHVSPSGAAVHASRGRWPSFPSTRRCATT